MSGIYIKGMEMPKRCDECRFDNEVYCLAYPQSADMIYDIADGIPQFCPLISVPDHGELVDANRLIDIALHLMHTAKNDDIANGVKWLWQYILEAPTIIPADKDGE